MKIPNKMSAQSQAAEHKFSDNSTPLSNIQSLTSKPKQQIGHWKKHLPRKRLLSKQYVPVAQKSEV
jgi:hypothetical protein